MDRFTVSDKRVPAFWTTTPPDVTDFNNQQWSAAATVRLQHYWSGQPAPPHRQAQANVLWSDSGLHLLFKYPQDEPLIINDEPQTVTKTMRLWERDVCEVFIAPGAGVPSHYFEFEAAPTGEWLDVAIGFSEHGRVADWKFQSGLTTSAKINEHFVQICLQIPWCAELPKPSVGETWRANFFRCVGDGAERGYVAWQPTLTREPNFHVPEVFGWLEFVSASASDR